MNSEHMKRVAHPFVVRIGTGETNREVLEVLLRDELSALEAQYRPNRSTWSHYDAYARQPDEALVAVFAALVGDEALWRRLIEHLVSKDYALRKEQKWSGVDPEDLGPVPTMEICARRLRSTVDRLLLLVPAARLAAAPALDRWEEALSAEDRAARQKREAGQKIKDPPLRVRSYGTYPDIAAQAQKLEAELERRKRAEPNTFSGRLFADGIRNCWLRSDFPDLAEAFDRLEDEIDRRDGHSKPVVRVKIGDTVVANGRRWKVVGVNARLNVADLEWREGTTSHSIPAQADTLVPEG